MSNIERPEQGSEGAGDKPASKKIHESFDPEEDTVTSQAKKSANEPGEHAETISLEKRANNPFDPEDDTQSTKPPEQSVSETTTTVPIEMQQVGETKGNESDVNRRKEAEKAADRPLENPPRQHTDNWEKLYQEARPARDELEQFAIQVAEKTGGELKFPYGDDGEPLLKERDTAHKKAEKDYGGDASRVVDIARGTIVYDTMDQIDEVKKLMGDEKQAGPALQEFAPDAQIVRVKDGFQKPTDMGYMDLKYNIQMSNGHVTELQIHLAPIEAAKNEQRPLYDEEQEIFRKAKGDRRQLTSDERTRLYEIYTESQEIFRKALEEKGDKSDD